MKRDVKSCSCCDRPAESSVSVLISTLHVSPREQNISQSVPLCSVCIQECYNNEASQSAAKLHQALRSVYTATKLSLSNRIQDNSASKR